MSRRATAAEAETYRPELLADEEPRYLRRQKPVEIRRKKFSGRSWPFYRRVLVLGVVGIAGLSAAWTAGRFLLYGQQMLLIKPEQIEVNGNHIVSREAVLQQFVHDRGRSVLRVPLDARRSALEEISWVESATVQRILPNRLRVDLTERTPVAFLRNGTELALIDAHGVILDRPHGEDLQFPIVTGLSENMPRQERGQRQRSASSHHSFWCGRLHRQIPHGRRKFCAVAGQQWPRPLHRFAVREAGCTEPGHQQRPCYENEIAADQ